MTELNTIRPLGAPPTHSQLVSAALALARLGLRPAPMIAAAKRPARKGWRQALSNCPDAVRAAFAHASHADGLAIATGAGLFVIDLDRHHGDGVDGVESFALLVRRYDGAIAKGPRVRTPRGGVHLYFAAPPEHRIVTRVALAPGIDVRGDGGLAMAPPSCCRGLPYRWSSSPFDTAIPAAPDWLLALVAKPPVRVFAPPRFVVRGDLDAYARAALNAEQKAVASAHTGARNHALFQAAAKLGALAASGVLPVDLVASALLDAAHACGLMRDDGAHAVEATIASGLRRGLANPRNLDRRRP